MEEITKHILHNITFIIGIIGIIIILIGLVDGLTVYIKNSRNFQKIRYIIGKHILLGLDFLVVKDIIETVFLKGSDIQVMDLALLIVIVAVRMALTSHTSKGISDIREKMEINKIHTKHLEESVDNLEHEEEDLEKRFIQLEQEEIDGQKRDMLLEKKLNEINKLLKK